MIFKDFYKILNVKRTASNQEIKQAYRDLVRKYHPDINPGNTYCDFMFREIVEAYETLGDLDKRLQYSITLKQDIINKKLLHKRIALSELINKNPLPKEAFSSTLAKQNPSISQKLKKNNPIKSK
jgi:DnaJ-class molecular chaperone